MQVIAGRIDSRLQGRLLADFLELTVRCWNYMEARGHTESRQTERATLDSARHSEVSLACNEKLQGPVRPGGQGSLSEKGLIPALDRKE